MNNNTSYKICKIPYLKVSVSAKVSTISGIGIGKYLSIGIGGYFGIGAALLKMLLFAALVAYGIALHAALLRRGLNCM